MEYTLFFQKFGVPDKLKKFVHTILTEDEARILNYCADKERESGDIPCDSSLIKSLYKKGFLITQKKGEGIYYKSNTFKRIVRRFVHHSPKFHELSPNEKAVFQEYIMEVILRKMLASNKPLRVVIPIEKVIRDRRQLIPSFQAVYHLRKSSPIAVMDCMCRTVYGRCSKPKKVCLVLGERAKFFLERGIGEKIDVETGLKIIEIAQENGLVHSVDNKDSPEYMCHCCACCCVFIQSLKKYGNVMSIGKSGFIAVIDLSLCDQCGICLERCIFEAIKLEGQHISVDANLCFGCGQCAYSCPQKAITLSIPFL